MQATPTQQVTQQTASNPPYAYGCDDGTVIDLMVVYSTAAKNSVGTATMLNRINLAVTDANAAFTRSGIATSLHLVYTYEVSYGGNNLFNDLNYLMNPSDGIMDDVPRCATFMRGHREPLGRPDGGSGIGYYPDPSQQGINASGINGMDWRGYNGLLLAHEVGHNLWCGSRPRRPAQADTPPQPYSHGYTQQPDNAWQDIMAHTPQAPQIPYYANPNVNWPGPTPPHPGPTGVAGTSDLYTTIMDTRHVIANFRATAVAGLPSILYVKSMPPPGAPA